jgi:multiple sugar transport system ATP-binding protein
MRVRLEQVTKRFGSHVAADSIDLDVDAGECLVLVGPSGCGKTTVLRLLAGLESADAGRIWIGDRLVNEVPAAERDVAMVFQNYALYPHFSVFDNIAFPLRTRSVARSEITARVAAAAERLGLDEVLGRKPGQLSGGQQQRVALARALVRSPAVYLMDEPLSNLDAQLRRQMRTDLKRLQQELKTTMVYVTHDQAEAMTLGSRVAIMQRGRIVQVGAPLELYRNPNHRFVATFLGSPAMNIVADTPSVDLGVRPEDVELSRVPLGDGWREARVVVVEPMGNETIATIEAGGSRVVVRGGAEPIANAGDTVWMRFAADRVMYFDHATGARINLDA